MSYEDEDEGLTHQERMFKELYARRNSEDLNKILVTALRRLHSTED